MVDTFTHRPVRISNQGLSGPYITISEGQLGRVRSVLLTHGIDHWADHLAVSVDGGPAMVVVNLAKRSDVQHIQALLDCED